MTKLLVLSEAQVKICLDMKSCLEANRLALKALAQGKAMVPPRLSLPYFSPTTNNTEPQDWTLFKPSSTIRGRNEMHEGGHDVALPILMGCKIVSTRQENPLHNLPLVPATVLSIHPATGIVQAVLAGTYLTGARTAAGSALATQVAMANRTLHHLVLFGAGLQASLHVQAIAAALEYQSFDRISIINRTRPRADALRDEILKHGQAERIDIVLLDDHLRVSETLSTADCVVAATNTVQPLFKDRLPEGCHVNGIGSYTPDMREIDIADQCRVWIDTPEAKAVGDLRQLGDGHPIELLGDILKKQEGNQYIERGDDRYSCTFYKAVGTAIQDVWTAHIVVEQARKLGIGTEIDMA